MKNTHTTEVATTHRRKSGEHTSKTSQNGQYKSKDVAQPNCKRRTNINKKKRPGILQSKKATVSICRKRLNEKPM